jgi:hypothetical protein
MRLKEDKCHYMDNGEARLKNWDGPL